MRAALSALALCLLAASPAAAGGYGELNAGLAAHNEAAWDDAIAHLTAALGDRALPAASVAAAHLARGQAMDAQGRSREALDDYTASIAALPGYRSAYVAREDFYYRHSRYDDAIADCTALMAMAPHFSEAWNSRSVAYRFLGRIEEALADADRVIGFDYKTEGYLLRSGAHQFRGDYKLALEEAETASRYSSRSPLAKLRQGAARMSLGDYRRAAEDFADWGELDKGAMPTAALLIAVARTAQGRDAGDALDPPKTDAQAWPAPIRRFFAGEITAGEVDKAAVAADVNHNFSEICQADYYVGIWQELHRDPNGRSRIAKAASGCAFDLIEYDLAKAALGAVP